ncbi:PPM-type phosphatase domain, Protein phosphatase 2C family [Artemisia annua]|uniref:PPM-type phosphatase domain, Protein phosphatase 2C family n=1 Tax=Artemisia annua TaxID=35608 RepID=A0A2U1LZP7_ARTAN|nr:PPM-type phosphatase domain, Protein phosphatase 2C family [Artemisia annua]
MLVCVVQSSGTTITFVIVEGSVIIVASVGDSRCILESAEGGLYYLSTDHRLDCSEEERERVTASGGGGWSAQCWWWRSANFPVYHTPVMISASRPSKSIAQNANYSTSIRTTSQMGPKKRKNSKDVSSAPS